MQRQLFFLLVVAGLLAPAAVLAVPIASNDFPSSITIGIVNLHDIQVTGQLIPPFSSFSAVADIDMKSSGGLLTFDVTGQIGMETSSSFINTLVFAFEGDQKGTWSPFASKDLSLSFMKIAYNSTIGDGAISAAAGGRPTSTFGSWKLEVDIDFVHSTQPAIGFLVTDAAPTLGGMPDAPQHAFDALNSLLNVGIVLSTYDGQFTYTSGVSVSVHTGGNLFAASVFDGVTIHYTGSISFQGGFHVMLQAEADSFQLGTDIDVSSAVLQVQYPPTPLVALNVEAMWAGVAMSLQGSISSSDIQFTGTAPGPWTIKHGSTPVVVSNMFLTFDYSFAAKQSTGELKGSVKWGSFPEVTGIMKYPADAQALGCFSLTAIIGDPSTATSLNGVVMQGVGTANASSSFPSDANELFSNDLKSITLSTYPDCGALFLSATLQTNTFGTVSTSFSMFEYAPISSVLAQWAKDVPADPPVSVASGSSYTVGGKEALQSLSAAFANVTPPILVARAYIQGQPISKAITTLASTAGNMRQQLLVQLTEHSVQTDAVQLLGNCVSAYSSVSWHAPGHYENMTWSWAANLDITNAHWPISQPAGLYLTDASFALADATFQMTVGEKTVMAQQGLNFVVDLDVSKSPMPALDPWKQIDTCVDKAFQVSGFVGNQEMGWFLQGEITQGCVQLSPDLQLSATSLRVASSAPQVSFASVVTLPQTQDLQFQVSGSFAAGGAVQLSGSTQSVYKTHVGAEPLEIDNLNLQLSVSSGAFSGSMSGAVTIDNATEVSASTSFDSSSKALSFSLTIHKDKPVLMFNLLKRLVGDNVFEKIPIPESGKDKLMGVYFVEGSLNLGTQPPTLGGALEVIAFYKLLVSASLQFSGGHVAFGFSVKPQSGLMDPIKLSDILPNITIIDEFRMSSPVIILADAPTTMTIPGISASFSVETGFNFAALLALDTTTPRSTAMTKWLGNNTVMIQGVIDPAEANFELQSEATLNNIQIYPGVVLNSGKVHLRVHPPAELDVGIEADAMITLGPTTSALHNSLALRGLDFDAIVAASTLKVAVMFDIGTAGASFDVNVTTQWQNPFGIRGVTFLGGQVGLSLGTNFASLASFILEGEAQVGSITGTATFALADGGLLAAVVMAVSLQGVDLERDLLHAICGGSPSHMFGGGQIQSATFSINPTLAKVAGFPPGIAIGANNFVIGSITLSHVEFAIDPLRGIEIQIDASAAATPSVAVGSGDGALALNSWDMDIDLMLGLDMGIRIQGDIQLGGLTTTADIALTLIDYHVHFNWTSTDFTLILGGGVTSNDTFHVPDLSLDGSLVIGPYLSTRLDYYAQQTEDTKAPEEKQIESKMNDLQNQIAKLNDEINVRSQNDSSAKAAAQAEVAKAQKAVSDAQSSVDSLQSQINDNQQKLSQCGKFDYVCQGKYKSIVLSLQAAKATADAALQVAQQALQKAQDYLGSLPDPDTDPQILAWKAEIIADQAAISTLQATLSADLAITQLASQVLQAGASALQPTSLTFHSDSFVALKKGGNGQTEVVGMFLNKPLTLPVPTALENGDKFVKDLWDGLQKKFAMVPNEMRTTAEIATLITE